MTIEFEGQLKRWGRSFGIVVPMEKIKLAKLRENEKVCIKMQREINILKETFGTIKLKKSVKDILQEGDKESWDE